MLSIQYLCTLLSQLAHNAARSPLMVISGCKICVAILAKLEASKSNPITNGWHQGHSIHILYTVSDQSHFHLSQLRESCPAIYCRVATYYSQVKGWIICGFISTVSDWLHLSLRCNTTKHFNLAQLTVCFTQIKESPKLQAFLLHWKSTVLCQSTAVQVQVDTKWVAGKLYLQLPLQLDRWIGADFHATDQSKMGHITLLDWHAAAFVCALFFFKVLDLA